MSPSSQAGLESANASIEAAGLEVGYTNNSVQFGSTDVGPLVLGILESGDDAVYTMINFDTSLALVAGLKQAGWDGTSPLPDRLRRRPARLRARGRGRPGRHLLELLVPPVENDTPATQQLSAALMAAGNESGIPGFYESQGWFGADLLIYGLEQAGCDASQEDLISTLQETDDWDANGLYPRPIPQTTTDYDEQCLFFLQLEGDGFTPLNDGEPFCGDAIES